ncbi:MAG: T9SS C-terminal target domain-containing protein [Chitinophagaceae bacterium]|nr:MAG: T9SS C-terminal target domain-containing protein [Chitinophagaceae bacterium]
MNFDKNCFLCIVITVCSLLSINVQAQFDIPEPIINTGSYTITDTVYMSPIGDDSNPGTFSEPVKSFNTALQKLPFGVAGVNNGNAYGLIMLKEGFYETHTGFLQSISNFQSGNTFKNVSIEGIGEVIIGGTVDSFANGHLLRLLGNHIFIKNIKLRYSHGIGLLLNRPSGLTSRQNNVLIENVQVDSVGNFSMLLSGIDTVLVRHSGSYYSSRPFKDSLTTPCQWPSGIKFLNSRDCIIHDSEIAYTRGEGLNFQNSLRGKAYNNTLRDNGLNFYNDNSAKLIVRNNHIYNTPGIGEVYWRNCPADTTKVLSGTGILIANEGSCNSGSAPVFENCMTKCILPDEFIRNVDSMFVYNNIFQNNGRSISFWQGETDHVGVNCVRNVFIFNNTIIGSLGSTEASNSGMVHVFYPSYNALFNNFYGTLDNIHISHNIISYDTAVYKNITPVRKVLHNFHPGPLDIQFGYNLWVRNHQYLGTNSIVRSELPAELPLLKDTLNKITPCDENLVFVYEAPRAFDFLTKDYLGNERTEFTNVGALEYEDNCNLHYNISPPLQNETDILIYPNPCLNCSSIKINGLSNSNQYYYQLFTIQGRRLSQGLIKNHQIEMPLAGNGIHLLYIMNENKKTVHKLVIKNHF